MLAKATIVSVSAKKEAQVEIPSPSPSSHTKACLNLAFLGEQLGNAKPKPQTKRETNLTPSSHQLYTVRCSTQRILQLPCSHVTNRKHLAQKFVNEPHRQTVELLDVT
jgi:hypothetical protein